MGKPIRKKDQQDTCNPISSNCVIWQGPDIPCIKLCSGDTVSDVVAKLAEELCIVLDELKLSTYDISCFNPVCPNPSSFSDLIQILINKICELENIQPTTDEAKSACPDNCIVTVASCLQTQDALGNTVTTLNLKDYVILIGNRICNMLTQISVLQANLNSLEERVKYIEDNCCQAGISITIPTSCLTGGVNVPIVNFVVNLETAFCALQTSIGNISTALAAQCVNNTDPQLSVYPAVSPTMNALLGWNTTPGNMSQLVQNLWLALCDARTAISTLQSNYTALQEQLAACCAADCNDIVWAFLATGVRGNKFIDLSFTGTIPAVFDYCGGATTTNIVATDALGNSSTFAEDVLNSILTGAPIDLDLVTAVPISEYSVHYAIQINLCLTDGNITCNTQRNVEIYNSGWCAFVNPEITSPAPGQIQVSWTSVNVPTNYNVSILTSGGLFITSASSSYSSGATRTEIFTGLTEGAVYKAILRSTQGTKFIDCETSSIICTETP